MKATGLFLLFSSVAMAQFEDKSSRELQTSKAVVNECTEMTETVNQWCGTKASCVDQPQGFSCSCNDGYLAIADQAISYCADVDECASGIANCDATNGFCVDWDPPVKFKCGCSPGFLCSNTECTRCARDGTHPCNSNNGGCDSNAQCVPLPNSQRSCVCNAGFEGDGATCTSTSTGGAPTPAPTVPSTCATTTCPDSASCQIVNGSPVCICKSGFFSPSGFGGQCVDIDECRTTSSNNCTRNDRSVCVNTPGAFRCQCSTGFLDFPGQLQGTMCRTSAEIRAALTAGGFFRFTTGLNGISRREFQDGSPAQTAYKEQIAEEVGVNASQINIFNLTNTISRRRLSDGRELQNKATSYGVGVRLESPKSDPEEAESDIKAQADRAYKLLIDLETQQSPRTLNFLKKIIEKFTDLKVNFNEDEMAETEMVALTQFIVFEDPADLDNGDLQLYIPESSPILEAPFFNVLGPISPISPASPSFYTPPVEDPTPFFTPSNVDEPTPVAPTPVDEPSASPSARRELHEVEENFFGDLDSVDSACECVECETDERCGGLWKEDFKQSTAPSIDVHLVVSHCSHDLKWLADLVQGEPVSSVSVFSKCGNDVTNAPEGSVVVDVENVGRNDETYVQWTLDAMDKSSTDAIVIFMKDNYNVAEKGTTRSMSELIRTADRRSFACGVKPSTLDLESETFSMSAYHDVFALKGFHIEDYFMGTDSYGEVDQAHFKSSSSNLGEWWEQVGVNTDAVVTPVCYGGIFATKMSALKKVPVSTWKNIEASLKRGSNIEEGHFMERTWAALLTTPLSIAESTSITMHADFTSENDSSYFGALMREAPELRSTTSIVRQLFEKAMTYLL